MNEAGQMFLTLLALAAQNATELLDVFQKACRVCTVVDGKQRCSNVGIGCQLVKRVCRPIPQQGHPNLLNANWTTAQRESKSDNA